MVCQQLDDGFVPVVKKRVRKIVPLKGVAVRVNQPRGSDSKTRLRFSIAFYRELLDDDTKYLFDGTQYRFNIATNSDLKTIRLIPDTDGDYRVSAFLRFDHIRTVDFTIPRRQMNIQYGEYWCDPDVMTDGTILLDIWGA